MQIQEEGLMTLLIKLPAVLAIKATIQHGLQPIGLFNCDKETLVLASGNFEQADQWLEAKESSLAWFHLGDELSDHTQTEGVSYNGDY